MSATGLTPDEHQAVLATITRLKSLRVTRERLNQYDTLIAEGGIEAVIQALEREQAKDK